MEYSQAEILETVRMTEMEHLDIRTVTLGLSLRDCATESINSTADRVREKRLRADQQQRKETPHYLVDFTSGSIVLRRGTTARYRSMWSGSSLQC